MRLIKMAWKLIKDTGFNRYYENSNGKRKVVYGVGGYQPVDRAVLHPDEEDWGFIKNPPSVE